MTNARGIMPMMRSRDDTHQSAQEKNWEPCPILIFYPNRHRCCKPRLNSLVLVEQEKATFFHDWGCCSRLTPNVDCPIMHGISISLATPCTHYAVVNKELTVLGRHRDSVCRLQRPLAPCSQLHSVCMVWPKIWRFCA